MVRYAVDNEISLVAELACSLWPDNSPKELEQELREIHNRGAAFFLAWEGERAVGFAQCQLRSDYVEGTEYSPVGYLEGIWVAEEFRRKGIAKELLAACEKWAESQGCKEFASDCELTNILSQHFHERMGFREANRIVCFVKNLRDAQ